MHGIKKALHHRVAVVVAAATLLSGGSAFAFSDTCSTYAWIPGHCYTLAIRPNPSSHTVTMNIESPGTAYTLTDNDGRNIIVRQGATGGGWHYETIGGLVNFASGYVLSCSAFAAKCTLKND
jgi:hypothetical protein